MYYNNKFVFVHIPKTAGTSFRGNIINTMYNSKDILLDKTSLRTVGDKIKVPWGARNRLYGEGKMMYGFSNSLYPNYDNYDMIAGHIKASKYKHLERPMITFLRDPVERCISNYAHLKRKNWLPQNASIIRFAEIYANIMTEMLDVEVDFYGISEEFDKSVNMFFKEYNIEPFILNDKVHRLAPHKPKVTDDERQTIKKLNKKDYELYNKTLDIFKQKQGD